MFHCLLCGVAIPDSSLTVPVGDDTGIGGDPRVRSTVRGAEFNCRCGAFLSFDWLRQGGGVVATVQVLQLA